MASETEAASPASPAKAASGDGKTAANVTADQASALLQKRTEQPAQPVETADTSATEAQAPAESSTESPAAEPAPTDSPDAPAETTAEETKPEAEAEADDVLSPENSTLDPKLKEKLTRQFQKRIGKEVKERKALEAQVEQMKAQLASITPPPQQQAAPTPPTSDPLPSVKDVLSLAAYKQQAKQALREAEELLDRDDIDQGVVIGDKTYTKAEIKASRRKAQVALEDEIPAKEEFFRQQTTHQQQRQQAIALANQTFPWLADQQSERFKLAAQAYQAVPALQGAVNGEYLAALIALGQEALLKKPAPPAAPAKAAPAAPKPKAPSDQAAATTTGTVQRIAPEAANRSALAVEMDKLRAKRGATVDATIEFLTKRDQMRHRA